MMRAGVAAGMMLLVCGAMAVGAEPGRIGVLILDEEGQHLLSTRAVRLAPGRVGVPPLAYQRLGLSVAPERSRRSIGFAVPSSDAGVVFTPGGRRTRDFLHLRPGRRHNFPLALLRRGRLYVSAHVMSQSFGDLFVTSWDSEAHVVVVQRSKAFARLLDDLGATEAAER
jgi:hypothetical protein